MITKISTRAWLALAGCALILGGVFGWAARATTADHRYIRALAERHEAEASYYYTQTDPLIRENKERKTNGTKKN